MLGVAQFRDDFAGMAARVKMVGVLAGLLLGALLATMPAVDVLVVFEIVMLVLVKMTFRHDN